MFENKQLLSLTLTLTFFISIYNITSVSAEEHFISITNILPISNKEQNGIKKPDENVTLKKELKDRENEISKLSTTLSELKKDKENENNISRIDDKIKSIESDHSIIFNIVSILLAAITLFGGGGMVFSFFEHKTRTKEMEEALNDFTKLHDETIHDFKNKGKSILQQLDQSERIVRLTHLISTNDFDDEVFFADLSQLSQDPTHQMSHLSNLIIGEYRDKFAEDVIDLAEKIQIAMWGSGDIPS